MFFHLKLIYFQGDWFGATHNGFQSYSCSVQGRCRLYCPMAPAPASRFLKLTFESFQSQKEARHMGDGWMGLGFYPGAQECPYRCTSDPMQCSLQAAAGSVQLEGLAREFLTLQSSLESRLAPCLCHCPQTRVPGAGSTRGPSLGLPSESGRHYSKEWGL